MPPESSGALAGKSVHCASSDIAEEATVREQERIKGEGTMKKQWFAGYWCLKQLKTSEWKYERAVFPALVWYWSNITWPELALDLEAATYVELTRTDGDREEKTQTWRAKIMVAATRRIEESCSEGRASGGREPDEAESQTQMPKTRLEGRGEGW